MGTVTAFPARRAGKPLPDAVRVGFDFGSWCVELWGRNRMVRRLPAVSEDAARAEAARLAKTGLRLLPDAIAPVTYYSHPDEDGTA